MSDDERVSAHEAHPSNSEHQAKPPDAAGEHTAPIQFLHQFYQRYKGHKSVDFVRLPVPGAVPCEDTGKYRGRDLMWHCTITLSGGHLNDSTPLPMCSLEGEARSKKGAEVVAHEAAIRHLTALGIINEASTAPSDPHTRWVLPRRRKEGSPLVFLDLQLGSQPGGRVVMELFEDLLPKTVARLSSLFHHHPEPSAPDQQQAAVAGSQTTAGSCVHVPSSLPSYMHTRVCAVVPRLGVQLSPPEGLQAGSTNGSTGGSTARQDDAAVEKVVEGSAVSHATAAAGDTVARQGDGEGHGKAVNSGQEQAQGVAGDAGGEVGGGWEDVLESFLDIQEGGGANAGVAAGAGAHWQMAPAGAEAGGEAAGEGAVADTPTSVAPPVHSQAEEPGGSGLGASSRQHATQQPEGGIAAAAAAAAGAEASAVTAPASRQPPSNGDAACQQTIAEEQGGRVTSVGVWDGQGHLVDPDEAADLDVHLPLDRVFRLLLPKQGGATEQAGLIITTHPAPQLADSHVVVGQVVRGHGSVRALQQVVTGKQYQPLEPCVVVACGALPHDLHLPSLPCLMDGPWPAWPDDLAPAGMHPPNGKSEAEWRCDLANEIRAAGNVAFRAQDWDAAFQKYTQALRYLDWTTLHQLSQLSYSGKKAMQAVEHTLRLNRAAAALQLGHGTSALEDVQAVVARTQPPQPKTLYRLAQAYSALHRFDEAVEALEQAAKLAGLEQAAGTAPKSTPPATSHPDQSGTTGSSGRAGASAGPEILAALAVARAEARKARQEQGAAYMRALSQQSGGATAGGASVTGTSPLGVCDPGTSHTSAGEMGDEEGEEERWAGGRGRKEGTQGPLKVAARLHAKALERMFGNLPCPGIQLSHPTQHSMMC